MKPYTFVLLRPDYIASDDHGDFGQDVYVALVKSTNPRRAFKLAQKEVFKVDSKSSLGPMIRMITG